MDVKTMLEVLRRDFGINSREEFETAYKNFKGLDIGIFTTPINKTREDTSSSSLRA